MFSYLRIKISMQKRLQNEKTFVLLHLPEKKYKENQKTL